MASMAYEATNAGPAARRRLRLVVAAATIGTALEWFDLVVYGFFFRSDRKGLFSVHA